MGDFHDDILAPSEMALIHDAMIGRIEATRSAAFNLATRLYSTQWSIAASRSCYAAATKLAC
jgi:hypothetical protein